MLTPKAVAFDMGGVVIPSPVQIFTQFEAENGLPKGAIGSAIRAGGDQGKNSSVKIIMITWSSGTQSDSVTPFYFR
jgi:hypothetical protein